MGIVLIKTDFSIIKSFGGAVNRLVKFGMKD